MPLGFSSPSSLHHCPRGVWGGVDLGVDVSTIIIIGAVSPVPRPNPPSSWLSSPWLVPCGRVTWYAVPR